MFLKTVHHRIIPVSHLGILNADSGLVSHEYDMRFCVSNRLLGNMTVASQRTSLEYK